MQARRAVAGLVPGELHVFEAFLAPVRDRCLADQTNDALRPGLGDFRDGISTWWALKARTTLMPDGPAIDV